MPSNFGSTPTSTTTLGTNQFPVSAARVPNADSAGNLTSIEGIAVNTDNYNFQTTAIRIGLKDGDDATQGTSTDAAGDNTVIGQLKQIRLNTASVTIGSALPAGGNLIGVVAFGGTTPTTALSVRYSKYPSVSNPICLSILQYSPICK